MRIYKLILFFLSRITLNESLYIDTVRQNNVIFYKNFLERTKRTFS